LRRAERGAGPRSEAGGGDRARAGRGRAAHPGGALGPERLRPGEPHDLRGGPPRAASCLWSDYPDKTSYMGRIFKRLLDLRLAPGRSAFLWGPRRVGKSFWVRQTLPDAT